VFSLTVYGFCSDTFTVILYLKAKEMMCGISNTIARAVASKIGKTSNHRLIAIIVIIMFRRRDHRVIIRVNWKVRDSDSRFHTHVSCRVHMLGPSRAAAVFAKATMAAAAVSHQIAEPISMCAFELIVIRNRLSAHCVSPPPPLSLFLWRSSSPIAGNLKACLANDPISICKSKMCTALRRDSRQRRLCHNLRGQAGGRKDGGERRPQKCRTDRKVARILARSAAAIASREKSTLCVEVYRCSLLDFTLCAE